MTVTIEKCPNCGAGVYRGMALCDYCGNKLSFVDIHNESPDLLKTSPRAQEFLDQNSIVPRVTPEEEDDYQPTNLKGWAEIIILTFIMLAMIAFFLGWWILPFTGPSSFTPVNP